MDGLAVRSDGTIFGTSSGGADEILTVDPDTGEITVVGETGVGGPSDLAFRPGEHETRVPEPGTWALCFVGLAGLAAVRRRRIS